MSFLPIRSSTLRPGVSLLFDLYVHYKESYLKYRSSSEILEPELLSRLRDKKVKKVFIPTAQESEYLRYLDQALEQLQSANAPVAERAELAQGTLRQEAESISRTLESEAAFRDSKGRLHKVAEFLVAEPKALADMLRNSGLSVDESSHGSTVSSLCLALGAQYEPLPREALTDLAIAALLHDTSLRELGFDLKSDLTNIEKERRVAFRQHPTRTVSLVAGKKLITPRALRIIEDHEEFGEGMGFPEKKWMNKLSADSKVFNLCDAFDHFCVIKALTPSEAIGPFKEARANHFDSQLVERLEALVKVA